MACIHGRVKSRCSSCGDLETIYKQYQKSAQLRNLRFIISYEQFRQTLIQPCYLCGEYGQPRGLDRKDNRHDLGYVPDNVASCCWDCNVGKGSRFSQHEFIALCFKVVRYQERLKKRDTEPPPDSTLVLDKVPEHPPQGPSILKESP